MLIDGKKIADTIGEELKREITLLTGRPPGLAVVQVGMHPASEIYIRRKKEACQKIGIKVQHQQLGIETTTDELLRVIQILNEDEAVDGILVQLPLPVQIDPSQILLAISPDKDVDGFHPQNVGKLLIGDSSGFYPCTPLGIRTLLMRSGIDVAGLHAVVVGRSNIVGKPMAAMLMQPVEGGNATVTVVHSKTKDLADIVRQGDLVIAAIGKARFITSEMIREGAVVIDVGINQEAALDTAKGYRIVGDVDFERVYSKCRAITPVPGGVGPMTIAMLLQNTFQSRKRKDLS